MSYQSMKGLSYLFLVLLGLTACETKESSKLVPETFKLLDKSMTGLDFENIPEQSPDFNVFNYMYFFNGGGIAAGDYNQDGLVDLYFTANMGPNKLFINEGNLQFKDVTQEAGVAGEGAWTTGASVVDINNDGLLDIYVNQMGDYQTVRGRNELFICTGIENGIPVFEDQAAEYGLDFIAFGTQASFFDYDLDGDLDMYQMNHSLHRNGTFGRRFTFSEKDDMAGDKLFRNDDGRFVEVSEEAGIYSTVIGYGLGIATGDVNRDGYPDIYIGNDFHENDYLYLNQQDGTFKEVLNEQIRHTSRFSMGVEIGDLNNDGWREIMSLDMLPDDPFILKSSLGEDDYGVFKFKLGYGYNHQYARNNLQLNNGDGTFSEIGIFANVFATDWSWAPIFVDFDHDGYKDLFVSNGIPRRMNDIDYIDFRAEDDVRFKSNMNVTLDERDLGVVEKMPKIKLPNRLFKNNGDLTFDDYTSGILDNENTFSNGVIYADLDRDGDLDIVTNNIEDAPYIYQNLTVENGSNNAYLSLDMKGSPKNPDAIGTRVIVYKGTEELVSEYFPVRGYQSSMLDFFHIGLGEAASIDSMVLIWPDNSYQSLDKSQLNQTLEVSWKDNLPRFKFSPQTSDAQSSLIADRTNEFGLDRALHVENTEFIEFHREKLMPHMVSREGPALAIGDINGDGLEDIFLGNAKREKAQIYQQTTDGTFVERTPAILQNDSLFEDVDAAFFDADGDNDLDLVVASGGNEYQMEQEPRKQRLYLNDGQGGFTRSTQFPDIFLTASCVLPADFDQDGDLDLFFGARAIPWNYGKIPTSYLLTNNGDGTFTQEIDQVAPGLKEVGLVKDGLWSDIDQDGDLDLLLAMEWEAIQLFRNEGGQLKQEAIGEETGWWNFLEVADFDNDGDLDILAGNTGENTKLKPTDEQPVRMYVNDFDENGQVEQILTYFLNGKEIPLPTFREVMGQMPPMKKDFLYSKDFARADSEALMGKDKMDTAIKHSANTFSNTFYENQNGQFVAKALPRAAQWSPLMSAAQIDLDGDGNLETVVGGNFYPNNIELGRYDAHYGQILDFTKEKIGVNPIGALRLEGEIREMLPIKVNGQTFLLIAKNNGHLQLIGASKSNLLSDNL